MVVALSELPGRYANSIQFNEPWKHFVILKLEKNSLPFRYSQPSAST
jgi:hypothetical protein